MSTTPTTQFPVPGSHVSPLYECGPCDPENEAAACALRAYIPVSTIEELNRISREECAECDKRRRLIDGVHARIAAIKEQMRKLRIELKQSQKQSTEYFRQPLFLRSDQARSEGWRAAREARAAAVARGESPRFETAAQTTARVAAARAAA